MTNTAEISRDNPYTAEISRDNPSCFLFLIDQSGSMEDEISVGSESQQLANGVADSINTWLQELSIKCAKSEGVRNYYDIGVLGYGSDVAPGFIGPLAGRELISISEIADSPASLDEHSNKVSDGAGGIVDQSVRIPVWFEPVAKGGTPMCRAAKEANRILEAWITDHPDAFPPTVIHITDGAATDGNPTDRLKELTDLSTSDGNVMLFNIHLSAKEQIEAVSFLDSPDNLPDTYSKMLFETASPLTPTMRALAKEHGFETSEDSHCFVLNGDLVLLVQAIDIGTRPSNVQMEGASGESEEFDDDDDAADIDDETSEDSEWSGDDENPR